MAAFFDHRNQLYDVFHRYTIKKSPANLAESDIDDGIMTLTEFGLVIEDSQLLGKVDGSFDLTQRDVRQAFGASQMDQVYTSDGFKSKATPKKQDTKAAAQTSNLDQNQLMSFPEFLEAVARVGAVKWAALDCRIPEKLEMAIQAVVGAGIIVQAPQGDEMGADTGVAT